MDETKPASGLRKRAHLRALSFVDQLVFSLANFVLTIALARSYSSVEFAGYGIGLSIALIVQSLQRNTYTVTTVLMSERRVRKIAGPLMGEHLIVLGGVAIIAAVAFLAISVTTASPLLLAIVVSAVTTGVIYFQSEFDRIVQIKHDRLYDPPVTSIAFFLTTLGLAAAAQFANLSFLGFMVGLLIFSVLKGLWLVVTTANPRFRAGWKLLRRDLAARFMPSLIGAAGYSGYNHMPIFILGVTSPPVYVAGFVAMRSLIQPLQIIVRSLDVIDKHVFGADSGSTDEGMRRVFWRTVAVYSAVGAIIMLVTVIGAEFIIDLAYGNRYQGFAITLVGWSLCSVVMVLNAPTESLAFATNRVQTFMHQRLYAGAVGVIASVILCPVLHDKGAILATLLGWIVALGLGVWLVRDTIMKPRGGSSAA
jgi:O-antigen/teichoic acid export membrane protein